MCSSKSKLVQGGSSVDEIISTPTIISHINGRPVLQPTCNRVPLLELERRSSTSVKKSSPKSYTTPSPVRLQPPALSSSPTNIAAATSTLVLPMSPKLKSPAVKRSGNDPNGLNSSLEKVLTTPRNTTCKSITSTSSSSVKKSKKLSGGGDHRVTVLDHAAALKYSSSLIVEAPGSIAAARREQVAIMLVQRKMRIAHYGRTKSAAKVVPTVYHHSSAAAPIYNAAIREEKRCTFITPNSDPIYVAYHDEEWGVPVHDDKFLFELLVLTGAQVGSDWTSVLKKRQDFRDAFSGFDAEIVSKFTERKITSINADYGIDLSQVRGVVDNSKRILEIKRELGSFDKYLWGFVNHKPIGTQYKSCHKIPVKTSKSEAISKDMVRRGFRLVGPTVMHSFMQAAGLTNDHLITCPRHIQCVALLAL
uniref:DNA-3-methyladenine glycosylase I n=1 Tax=Davidia involucrata TaxID=16924 RepID=A0A5B7B1V6_DAVIN